FRMQKISLLLTIGFLLAPSAWAAEFNDVPADHSYHEAITFLADEKIVSGNPDGTFLADASVNRVAALKMILRSVGGVQGREGQWFTTGFPDVPSDSWFSVYVRRGKEKGIVSGNADGTFAPDRQVARVELISMLTRAFKVDLRSYQELSTSLSTDTVAGAWYLPSLRYAVELGLIVPQSDGRLEPSRVLTRGEVADMLYRMITLRRNGEVQQLLSSAEADLIQVLVALNQDNISEALARTNQALADCDKAMRIDGSKGVVRAAQKIAQGFKNLTLAYQAALDGNREQAQQYVGGAKEMAGLAYDADPSTQPVGKKIKQLGDELLAQL
ncbi:MAG: S-layer homology domain-containing protein, partial [bacterium]|nr:S-layer homology domain-containing protein [bacterium]